METFSALLVTLMTKRLFDEINVPLYLMNTEGVPITYTNEDGNLQLVLAKMTYGRISLNL